MKRIVIINGHPGAGKDAFVKYCEEFYGSVANIHTSTPAKMALKVLGWNGILKTPSVRSMLAELMSQSAEEFDGPFKYTMESVKQCDDEDLIFIHSREPENISRYVKHLRKGNNVVTLIVRRPSDEVVIHSNDSDADVEFFDYDFQIDNSGSLEDLKDKAMTFVINFLDKEKQDGK